jgi:linoleoyl-CoA desaturase
MSVPAVKFNRKDQPEFVRELRKRVNNYFQENNISKHANLTMKIKTAFMLVLYFTPLILLISGSVSNIWMILLMWVLMGLGMAGIGLAVMHDANHGAYSQSKTVNQIIGFVINFIGGYHVNWRIQHNVLHHSYTNVDGHDEDLENLVMRLSPYQEHKKIFKLQFLYAPLFYGIMTLFWTFGKDFIGVARYDKKDLLEGQGRTYATAMAEVFIHKSWYLALTLVLPMLVLPIAWWQTVLFFLLMHFICGLFLALIFQPAHVIEETDFISANEDGSVENSWAIHQLRTTANFANGSRFFSWFVGGLNYQIEHHLFPNICHVHYRKISKIVKETAQEFNLPYHQHKTFFAAVRSHFILLYQLGMGSYDDKIIGNQV